MKRLAVFLPDMIGAGAQRVMLNLVNGFAARNLLVDLVLTKATGPYLNSIAPSVRVIDLKAHRVLTSLPGMIRYLRQEQPMAILTGLATANCVALWARKLAKFDTRLVISEHNTMSVNTSRGANWRDKQLPRLARQFYPWADNIVAVSKGVADDLARVTSVPRAAIQVIYNPVVTPDVCAKAQMPADHPWFGSDQPPVVLGVGRLTEQKNFADLLTAFALVRQHRPARLIILGEGEQRPLLEEQSRQLHLEADVCLPGFVDNPYAYMAAAKVFALSSRWEGLPTVLIEALYCGAQLVSTDCPSGPREILAGGQLGQLVPVGDVLALARAIEHALSGAIARPSADSWQPFSLDTVVEQYLSVLGISLL